MSDSPSESGQNASGPVGRSFIRVYNLWHKRVKEALRGIGLTHPQYVVLASLGYLAQSGDEVSQVDIARNSDIDVMTVSTILRNLERDGLVTRRTSSDDQRAKTVQMTVSGRSSLKRALPLVEGIDADFLGRLGEDRTMFDTLLHRLMEEQTDHMDSASV